MYVIAFQLFKNGLKMGYYVDLKKMSIDKYRNTLKSTNLLPSWKILALNIDKNLEAIKQQNIHNLNELLEALKTKNKLQEFSTKSGLSVEYLTVLRRVVNGYLPKPNRIMDFPGIAESVVNSLKSIGIKNTLNLYNKVLTPKQRTDLSNQTGIPQEEINELTRLCDISRVKWVNHTFAFVLFKSGYRSAEEIANADYKEMYENIKKLNSEQHIYKGNIGVNDMKRCVDAAKGLEFEIAY